MQPDVANDQLAMDQYQKLVKGKQCGMQWLLLTVCAVGRVIWCVFSLCPSKQFTIWGIDCRYAVCWQDLTHMPLQSLAQHFRGSDVTSKVCHTQVGTVSRLCSLLLADKTKFLKVSLQSKQLMCWLYRENTTCSVSPHSSLQACKLSNTCVCVQKTCRDSIQHAV